jgi:hypothetical protein
MPVPLPFSAELSAALGAPGEVRRIDSSPRSAVWQIELGGQRAVVKQIAGGTDADERYGRELTALRLASRAEPTLVPEVLGVDPGRRVMVLEFLEAPFELPDWVTYAEGLARLHAVTGPADAGSLPAATGPTTADVEAFLRLCAAMEVKATPAVGEELAALVDRLASDHGFALRHGDPCVGNVLAVEGRAMFIDLEGAALGDGLAELAYLHIGFPTCWQVLPVPAEELAEAEAAYGRAWLAATGQPLAGDVSDHCAGWLVRSDGLVERAERGRRDQFARLVEEDFWWGPTSARQRLTYRLDVVGSLCRDRLPATAALARTLRDTIVTRWPAAIYRSPGAATTTGPILATDPILAT